MTNRKLVGYMDRANQKQRVRAGVAGDRSRVASWSGFKWASVLAMGVFGLIGLYLLKSALGINLMAGHSFMHDLFYNLIR